MQKTAPTNQSAMAGRRQKAAILFLDIEGYTTLIQEDEDLTIALINRFQQVMEEAVPDFGGRVIQYYGDGCLSLFQTPGQAVHCALRLQKAFGQAPRVPVRAGIHYGEVVWHDDKLFGTDVNIASRIESLGQPGAVLFSRAVREGLAGEPELESESLGTFHFKNVHQPMEVFALKDPALQVPDRKTLEGKLEPPASGPNWFAAILGVLLLILSVFTGWYLLAERASYREGLIGSLNPPAVERSIAVLPFLDLSPKHDQAYFADGLAEELIYRLSREPELKVTSRSSSFAFKEQTMGVQAIGDRLGVAHLVEGSIRRSGDQVRILARLVRVEDGRELWSETFETELEDLFAVQDEISQAVLVQLRGKLLGLEASITERHPVDPDAYQLYLRSQYLRHQGGVEAIRKQEKLLKESLRLDSAYAPVWSALSASYCRQSNIGVRPVEEGFPLARSAARKALELDPNYGPAYASLVFIAMYYDWDLPKAQEYLDKAEQLNPGSLEVTRLASSVNFCLGNLEEAVRLDRKAVQLDPVSTKKYLDLGYSLYYSGKLEEAESQAGKALELEPEFLGGNYLLSLILLRKGASAAALRAAREEPYEILSRQAQALSLYALDQTESAGDQLDRLEAHFAGQAAYQVAQVYAFRGETDQAFYWLDQAHANRDGGLLHMLRDPLLENLHGDPRWEKFLLKMGFAR